MKKYFIDVLVGLDQFLNTVCGGNPDTSISARVGYWSYESRNYYWITLEKIIDWAFLPIDGENHCLQQFKKDSDEKFNNGNDYAKALLALGVVIVSVPIGIVARLYDSIKERF